jgi:hypothetical protein
MLSIEAINSSCVCCTIMLVEVNVTTWGALFRACKSYGNVEFGEVSAKQCDEFIFDGHFHLQNHMLASKNNFRQLNHTVPCILDHIA